MSPPRIPNDDPPLLFRTRSGVSRTLLIAFLEKVTRSITRGRAIECVITTDADLRRLNERFLGKDHATDVLSFPAASGNSHAGDLAISIDRARAQAREHGHSLVDELRILILHGALHLSGLDHENDSGEMERAEVRWRRRLGLPTGLIERTSKK